MPCIENFHQAESSTFLTFTPMGGLPMGVGRCARGGRFEWFRNPYWRERRKLLILRSLNLWVWRFHK
mgnify:CR=1 FL=1